MKKKVVITGGTGRFGLILKKQKTKYKLFFPSKKKLNILNYKTIQKYLKETNPLYFIHLAGLSRPMSIHDTDVNKSIDLNIIGTANVTKACQNLNIKLIYFSTNYVYPNIKGTYKENDPILPINNYAWSKLGGEASVQLYKNSLIVRVCMTEKPFVHKYAFANVKTNFMYQEDVAKILFKILDKKGIINVGGKPQLVYEFVKKDNTEVKKSYLKSNQKNSIPKHSLLNLNKIKRILHKI